MSGKKAALVFSGGALRGFSQIGAYKKIKEFLDREGITIDTVVGTSFGSITATLIALGYSPDEMEGISRENGLKLANFRDLKVTGSGLLKGEYLRDRLKNSIGDKTFDDTLLELDITAVDIRTGTECLFNRRGIEVFHEEEKIIDRKIPLIDAIRASTAIPALFEPVRLHGKLWVDGGLINPIALNTINFDEYDTVIAVDVCMGNFDFIGDTETPNKIQMIQQSISITQRQFIYSRLGKYMREHPNLRLIKPNVGPVNPRKKGEMDRIIQSGYDEAEKILFN
ncbi:MAG: patatin-like phospholipase family protein [Candidatus Woesearchaeota archaeon]